MAAEGKVDRRVVRTRKAIMAAFDKLVVERGIEKLTVSAIAREADIDRKTFYLHYSSIDDLVAQRTELSLGGVLQALRDQGEGRQPAERVHIVLSEVNAALVDNLAFYSSIASSLSIEQVVEQFFAAVRASLERAGIDIEASDLQEIRMCTQFYIAGAFSLYSTWLKSDHADSIEQVSKTIEQAMQGSTFPTMRLANA